MAEVAAPVTGEKRKIMDYSDFSLDDMLRIYYGAPPRRPWETIPAPPPARPPPMPRRAARHRASNTAPE